MRGPKYSSMDEDLGAFVRIMGEACDRVPMRVVAYGLMPNHFHVVLWPHTDGDLSRCDALC